MCSRINCSVVSTSVLFEETKLNANKSSFTVQFIQIISKLACFPLHQQSQQSQQTQALFAGANICVIKIQLPVVPCFIRESKRSTNSATNSLKRRQHFRESSQQFQWSVKRPLGRFPFNKNYRFKFSEFSLVEWNASDRFPGFVVTCPATEGLLGDQLLCMKMADFLNIFAALEQDECEITSCTIPDSNGQVKLWAEAKTWFNNMAKRREQNYWRAKVEGSVIRSKLKKKT